MCLRGKLNRGEIPIKEHIKKIEMEINGDCPYCGSHLEDVDHLFRNCLFIKEVLYRLTDLSFCPLLSIAPCIF